MSVLICFALKEEAAPFRKMVAGCPDVSIVITGIGRKNAEKSVREFLAGGASVPASRSPETPPSQVRLASTLAAPELVLTCGFAGGLNPDLKLGDVVFELSTLNSQLSTHLSASGAKPARFFCAARIATTVAEKKKVRVETGADAVEMESAAIHAVCLERGIPCATVRVISDTANEDLPLDFNALAKPDMNLDYGKLAWAIARSPGKIGALLQLQKKTKYAAEQLANVLSRIL
jgi:adenosylhomocysteine nucleosidase